MPGRSARSLQHAPEPSAAAPASPLSYVARPKELRRHNRVDLLRSGGESFPAMLEAIAAAEAYIHFSTYIWRDDKVGAIFQRAIIVKARAGIPVRVIYDGLGSLGLPTAFVDEMRSAGAQVVEYHPMAPWRPRWGLNRRNHQKILVVDGAVAFTGGLNIGDEYAPEPEGGGWHDMHARVEGPLVQDLEEIFRRTWLHAIGESYPPMQSNAPHQVGPAYRMLGYPVDNFGLRNRSRMYHSYLHAIRQARESIHLMSAYFIPDRRLRREFRRAVARGVSVQVIVPSISDVPLVLWAGRYLYGHLLRGGVRIFEWPERMMHAKTGVIDVTWSTIGSYNLDARSFLHNLEVAVVIVDRPFAESLEQVFQSDVSRCRELQLAEWKSRPISDKVKDWLAHRVRYWL